MYVFQKLQFSSIKPWCKLLQSNIDIISGLSLIPSLFLFSLQSVTDTKIILLKRFILLTTKSLSPKSILLTSQEKLAAIFLTHPPRVTAFDMAAYTFLTILGFGGSFIFQLSDLSSYVLQLILHCIFSCWRDVLDLLLPLSLSLISAKFHHRWRVIQQRALFPVKFSWFHPLQLN